MSACNKRQRTLFSFFALPARADHLATVPCISHIKDEHQQASWSNNAAGDDDMCAGSPAACSPRGHDANSSAVTSQTFVSDQQSPRDLAPDSDYSVERSASRVPDKQIPAALPSGDTEDLTVSNSEGLTDSSADNRMNSKPSCHEETNVYEQQRQERIRRNHERMQSLGLHQIAHASISAAAPCSSKSTKPKAKTKAKAAVPQRSYSLRARAGSASAVSDQAQPQDSQDLPGDQGHHDPVTEVYDDSSVLTYVCQAQSPSRSSLPEAISQGPIQSFTELPGWLSDSKLVRAYSMDLQDSLLAAGGKNGHAAVFGIQQAMAGKEGERLPLLSAKLHKSWIADVQLLPTGPAYEQQQQTSCDSQVSRLPQLLTASNDGSVSLWDLSKCCDGRPQQVAHTETLHTGGIWSMHCRGGSIATASKDCSVVVSSLAAAGSIVAIHSYDQQHAGAVKCARWRDYHVLASSGNDMCIKIMDTRSHVTSQVIEAAHDGCVNCVRWHPHDPCLLLSTGTDPCLHLWDLRHTTQPLHSLRGHTALARCSQIYQAQFAADGNAVVCGGPKSLQLSLYCSATGRTVSRGTIGFEPTAMLSVGSTLFCATTKQIMLYHAKHTACLADASK